MEAITNTTNEQKCNQNIVDAMLALYAFALQQQVPVSDTFCWHSQHCSPSAVCLHTCIKLYVPTPPREHPAKILQDYLLFDQKLQLRYYFEEKEVKLQNQPSSSILKHSTGWTPPGSQDQNFDSYRHLTQRELLNKLNIAPKYKRFNLPKAETNAIKSLAKNDKITIKPVDKGGKIVIQDTMYYIKECKTQLNDTTYYRRLYSDPTQELNNIIKAKLEKGFKKET